MKTTKRKLDYEARIPEDAWPNARKLIEMTWRTCREREIDGDLAAVAFASNEAILRMDSALASAEAWRARAERESMQQFEQAREMCRQRNGETRKLEAANARAERFHAALNAALWCLPQGEAREIVNAALATSAPDAGKEQGK